MKMKKFLSLVLVMALCLTALAACGGNGGTEAPAATNAPAAAGSESPAPAAPAAPVSTMDTLIVRNTGDPMSFNPTVASDDNLYYAAQCMFHRLTKLDTTKSPVPDAAESWDVSDDALTITWHLKDGLKWSDGEPLTADDVKYTFDYIKSWTT